jgi:hypothetical protein
MGSKLKVQIRTRGTAMATGAMGGDDDDGQAPRIFFLGVVHQDEWRRKMEDGRWQIGMDEARERERDTGPWR